MAASPLLVETNGSSYEYNSIEGCTNELTDDTSGSAASTNDEDEYRDILSNEHSLLLPAGGSNEYDEEDSDEIRANDQRHMKYRQQNRFFVLALVALTPTGVKFFKAAQSSFQEYLMTDPQLMMSATTYSLSLSLMSLPLATLIGGAMLDFRAKIETRLSTQQPHNRSRFQKFLANLSPSEPGCVQSSRTPSYSAIIFLTITLLGIILYGYGLETLHSIPVGLAGSTVFGLGEGCVVVASRTFVAHAFYGSDGAFAQGVLVAMNNLAMMASKISLPWLIENQNKFKSLTNDCIHNVSDCLEEENLLFGQNATMERDVFPLGDAKTEEYNIWIGVVACAMVQTLSLVAGIIYAWKFGLVPLPTSHLSESPHKKKKSFKFSDSSNSVYSRVKACFDKLPITFWIVAIGRAIFVVVFKVFTRNSNSFLMVSKDEAAKKANIDRYLGHSHIHPVVTLIVFTGKIWCKPRNCWDQI